MTVILPATTTLTHIAIICITETEVRKVEFIIRCQPYYKRWVTCTIEEFDANLQDEITQTAEYVVQVVFAEYELASLRHEDRFLRTQIDIPSKDIKEALKDNAKRRFMQVAQHDELKRVAEEYDILFNEFFYIKTTGFGWSQCSLDKPQYWYLKTNTDDRFESCCTKHDTVTVWYTIYVINFTKPDEGVALTSLEDIEETVEEFNGKMKGHVCVDMHVSASRLIYMHVFRCCCVFVVVL